MQNILLIFVFAALSIATAAADSLTVQKPSRDAIKDATPNKPLAAKRSGGSNVCAAYGPGFVKVAGSDTCVKLGGSVSVGVSGGR